MSTPLAIASVTAVLRILLNNRLQAQDISDAIGGTITASALPPDRIIIEPNEPRQLNLFMFQVTHNQGWRNTDLPSHNSRGERVSNPPLALNLHYLLTAYGPNELISEILLGFGMQLLHEMPVLARETINQLLSDANSAASTLPNEFKQLITSELAEQIEQIKITPESMNTEEISKLWAAFGAKYRPTSAYQATVVLIESNKSTRTSLPVRKRNIYAIPFKQPKIEKIISINTDSPPLMADQPILAGYNLVLQGNNLQGDDVIVKIGGIETAPNPEDIKDTEIIVGLPPDLASGVHGVQVIHQRSMGDPPVPHFGVESNLASFILQPRLENITVSNSQSIGNNLFSGVLNVTIDPAVERRQRAFLLLNELSPVSASPPQNDSIELMAYSFKAELVEPSPPGATNNLEISFRGVKEGAYLARISVDGAESPLSTNAEGQYNAPQVTIE